MCLHANGERCEQQPFHLKIYLYYIHQEMSWSSFTVHSYGHSFYLRYSHFVYQTKHIFCCDRLSLILILGEDALNSTLCLTFFYICNYSMPRQLIMATMHNNNNKKSLFPKLKYNSQRFNFR